MLPEPRVGDSTLYDDDILLWSERQAAAIRSLARLRDIPNELDIVNVAEEIESVGRSELAAVKSHIRLIFVHLLRIVVAPKSDAARHWRGEIVAFHSEMVGRYTPSMRQRIDIDELWRSAREQVLLDPEGGEEQLVASLPEKAPFTIDELLAERIDGFELTKRLRPFD